MQIRSSPRRRRTRRTSIQSKDVSIAIRPWNQLTTYICQGDRCRESVNEACASARNLVRAHTFGTHIVGHDLGRVDRLHGGKAKRKDGAEDENKADGRFGCRLASGVNIS